MKLHEVRISHLNKLKSSVVLDNDLVLNSSFGDPSRGSVSDSSDNRECQTKSFRMSLKKKTQKNIGFLLNSNY